LWEEFAHEVLRELEAIDDENADDRSYVTRLQDDLHDNPFHRDLVVQLIDRRLRRARPSHGYGYLANLISEGYYSTVISTNWDSLLEDSLHRFMRYDEVVVVARDSAPDEYLARAIRESGNRFLLVKLHGDPKTRLRMGEDLSTRSLSREILEAVSARFSKIHIVGSSGSDLDVLQLLFQRVGDADVLVVSPDPASVGEALRNIATSSIGGEVSLTSIRSGGRRSSRKLDQAPEAPMINVGTFDHFFCQLALSVERRILRSRDRAMRLHEIENALLRKEEVGLSYINSSQLTRMARSFVRQVTRFSTPDMVFFVNDPTAPGGMEIKKRIEDELVSQGILVGVLHIEGERNNRSFRRSFRGPADVSEVLNATPEGREIGNIHILDSITFSGNTLKIARLQVEQWYPHAEVRLGALVISQMLLDQQKDTSETDQIYHEGVTDRFEIFFPWGVTQTTADFDRTFPSVSRDRVVHINRRPWGAVETLVDEELCSVRLLTIESGRRLSFQRHLCRDELFVALDDNIGLDVCAADLDPGADHFDPAVKSMVLEKGDYALVSRGIWHRTKASMDRVRLLEVAFGVYDQVYDIERLFDDFQRTNRDGSE
jgi:mannose-6-phosphate isomerase-like protein (cupin superfamily)